MMARVKSRDTQPELLVRRLVFSMGYRYRLCDGNLPGRPDLVFRSRRKVIFVHGCFWHRHTCRRGRSTPKSRVDFWTKKFEANRKRDRKTKNLLLELGWTSLVIWECQIGDVEKLCRKIERFLEES